MNYLIAFALIASYLVFPCSPLTDHGVSHNLLFGESIETPCSEGSFTVEGELEAPTRLSISEALCDGSSWKARLTLENASGKVISGYDIANIETYEFKGDVKSGQGQDGIKLEPRGSVEINSDGGFRNGRSYGKATGNIRKNVFRVERIKFADGRVGNRVQSNSCRPTTVAR